MVVLLRAWQMKMNTENENGEQLIFNTSLTHPRVDKTSTLSEQSMLSLLVSATANAPSDFPATSQVTYHHHHCNYPFIAPQQLLTRNTEIYRQTLRTDNSAIYEIKSI